MGEVHEAGLVGAAVSPLVAGAVAGAATRRRVLGVFDTCVYVELGAHERVLAVLASDALHLPIGLRLARPSSIMHWGVEPGDEVLVGAGRVVLPHHEIVASRLARPSRVHAAPRVPTVADVELLPDPGVLGELTLDLTSAALDGRSLDDGVLGLVGAGRGLTPSGDDALCGVLLALASVEHPTTARSLAALRDRVLPALSRTTSLSAALVVAASSGYAVPDVVRLITLTVRPGADRTAYAPTLERVLAIGHSSGRDLLSGVSGALRALALLEPHPTTPPPEGAHRA
ncbi:uncharacterized protein DUF2877 [Humibacillus xanthopallidus]|uniref:Uncharacterized protein DUF2877 n=1 Tax=Humibacillus xanthopallidus TaxID=412689 RepID=A0A543PXQ6_9MICO|nr:DUF2877 domain-containing protein [Humibacillus xanthopallidus]TQN48856.1 uncharacterized protein DUF2877 [Humibacillus xanthopallidus]